MSTMHLYSEAPEGEAPSGSITFLEAITQALRDAMREDDRVFLLGEDIGYFGGAFGVTKGLWEEFGDARVLDTPIVEEGFVGAAFGAAWMGERPIVELQFADFITCPFDQIVTVGRRPQRTPRSGRPAKRASRAGTTNKLLYTGFMLD